MVAPVSVFFNITHYLIPRFFVGFILFTIITKIYGLNDSPAGELAISLVEINMLSIPVQRFVAHSASCESNKLFSYFALLGVFLIITGALRSVIHLIIG